MGLVRQRGWNYFTEFAVLALYVACNISRIDCPRLYRRHDLHGADIVCCVFSPQRDTPHDGAVCNIQIDLAIIDHFTGSGTTNQELKRNAPP